jgi:hypothetical protein
MFRKSIISLCLILFTSPSFASTNLKNNETFDSFFSKPLTENRMHSFYKNPPENFLSSVMRRDSSNVKNEENLEKLVCFGAEKYPDEVGEIFSTYCGGSCDSFVPTCSKYNITNVIPQIKPYFDKLYDLSGSDSFSGTLIYSKIKNWEITRIKIATSQNFINELINSKKDEDDVKFYLENFWSVQGVWENEQYKLLQNLKKEALPYFGDYYKKKFNFDDKKSKLSASVMANFSESLYLSSFHDDWKDECFYQTPRLGKTHLQSFISNNKIEADLFLGKNFCNNKDKLSSNEIYSRLLLVAVVDQQSTATIKKLLNKIDNPDSKFLIESFHQSAPKYPEALELIIKKFPTIVNSQNVFGKTALMYAAQYGNLKSAEILIKNHADINLATTDYRSAKNYYGDYSLNISVFGRTPLIYAAWQGKPEMVELLVKSKANKLLHDSGNKSAVDYLDKNINLSAEQKSQLSSLLKI